MTVLVNVIQSTNDSILGLGQWGLLANIWQWFRPGASTNAYNVDWLFWFITGICILFFVPITALLIWFMVKYRARPGHEVEKSPHHNNALEITWSVIPLLFVVAIFFYGFVGFLDMRNAPDDSYEINVIAKKWNWSFVYPNGHVDANLHVPAGKPVKLVMSSQDVLHSLYVPAFRVKMDCVPGKYTTLWFNATEPAEDQEVHELFCTEYCGTGHSTMVAHTIVHKDDSAFEVWMADATDVRKNPPAEVGETLYKQRGCAQCHSIDGSDRAANGGPSFKGNYGKTVAWTNGQEGPVDENYIRESILNPMAKIRKGFRPIMPTYQGQLKDDEIFGIIQYIKQLNSEEIEDWPAEEGEEGAEAAESDTDSEQEPSDSSAEEEPEQNESQPEEEEPSQETSEEKSGGAEEEPDA